MRLAEARCQNPACKTLTSVVVEDSETMLKCAVCSQFNAITSRRNISDGECHRCNSPLDDHQFIGDQAVCRKGK